MIRVSKEHGVNPSLALCFLCNEPKAVMLLGALSHQQRDAMFGPELSKQASHDDTPHSAAAPRQAVYDKEPCDTCKTLMLHGIICISARSEPADAENPYRTGGWVVLTEDAVRRMFKHSPALPNILKKRATFIADEIWDHLGLPRASTTDKTEEDTHV